MKWTPDQIQTAAQKRNESSAHWKANHPEQVAAYLEATKEHRRAYARAQYAANPAQKLEANKLWVATHSEQQDAYLASTIERRRETKRAWHQANKTRVNQQRREQYQAKRGAL